MSEDLYKGYRSGFTGNNDIVEFFLIQQMMRPVQQLLQYFRRLVCIKIRFQLTEPLQEIEQLGKRELNKTIVGRKDRFGQCRTYKQPDTIRIADRLYLRFQVVFHYDN